MSSICTTGTAFPRVYIGHELARGLAVRGTVRALIGAGRRNRIAGLRHVQAGIGTCSCPLTNVSIAKCQLTSCAIESHGYAMFLADAHICLVN